MNYATGRPERPLTPRRPADRGRDPSLGPYLLAAARPRSLRRHGAVTGHGAGSRGHGRAGLTDYTPRNGPVRTSAINRRSGCVCARDRRRPSEDREGAGGHPEVTGARALRGKRPGHAPQCAPARGLPAPVPHRLPQSSLTQQVLCACAGSSRSRPRARGDGVLSVRSPKRHKKRIWKSDLLRCQTQPRLSSV